MKTWIKYIITIFLAVLHYTNATNLLQQGAIITGSSFFGTVNYQTTKVDTEHYFTAIADNNVQSFWRPMELQGPHWLEMRWHYPIKINEIQWHTQNIPQGNILFRYNNQFKKFQTINQPQGSKKFPTIITDRLRFEIKKYEGIPRIHELIVKGPEQILPPNFLPEKFLSNAQITILESEIIPRKARPGDIIKINLKIKADSNLSEDCLLIADLKKKSPDQSFFNYAGDFDLTGGLIIFKKNSGTTPQTLTLSVQLPEYSPITSLPLYITAITSDKKHQIRVKSQDSLPYLTILKTSPNILQKNDITSKLALKNGQMTFNINKDFYLPLFMRWYSTCDYERFFNNKPSGLNIQHYLMYPDCIKHSAVQRKKLFNQMDLYIRSMLQVRPESLFLLGMDMRTDNSWNNHNTSELMKNKKGKIVATQYGGKTFSFSSEKYLKDSYSFLDELIAFLKKQPYYNKIIGYYPWCWSKADAFISSDYNINADADRKDTLIGDFSIPAKRAFRDWLRKEYNNDLSALRKAWGKNTVTFENAFPDPNMLTSEDYPGGVFRNPLTSRPVIDYWKFFPTQIGNYNRKLAAYIKQKTDGKALVLVHYGAVIGCLQNIWPSGSRHHSNNLDFYNLLKDDNIDMYVQSHGYGIRHADDLLSFFHPIESLNLNNRIFLADYDIRTIAAGTLSWGRHRSQYETQALIYRDLAWLMIKNCGAWLADMGTATKNAWTEYRIPWFSTPEVTTPIRKIQNIFKEAVNNSPSRENINEIAVVINLRSIYYEDMMNPACIYRNLVENFMYKTMSGLGAPYDVIISDDLNNPRLKKDYKLYIFLNPFYLTSEEKLAIEKLKSKGRTLFWFYAPGYLNDKTGFDLKAMKALTGIDTAVKNHREALQMTVLPTQSLLTDMLNGRTFDVKTYGGARNKVLYPEKIQPVFYIDDPKATILAKYPDGKAAWAVKDFGSWKSVYSAVPNLDFQAVQNLARYAGVHLYCDEKIVMNADNRMLMFSNGYQKQRNFTVRLPQKKTVRDAFSGKIISKGKKAFSLSLKTPETRIFFLE